MQGNYPPNYEKAVCVLHAWDLGRQWRVVCSLPGLCIRCCWLLNLLFNLLQECLQRLKSSLGWEARCGWLQAELACESTWHVEEKWMVAFEQICGRNRWKQREWAGACQSIVCVCFFPLCCYIKVYTQMYQPYTDHRSTQWRNTLERPLSTNYENRGGNYYLQHLPSSHLLAFMFSQSSGFALKALPASRHDSDIIPVVCWALAKFLLGFHFQGFQLYKSATVSLYTPNHRTVRLQISLSNGLPMYAFHSPSSSGI